MPRSQSWVTGVNFCHHHSSWDMGTKSLHELSLAVPPTPWSPPGDPTVSNLSLTQRFETIACMESIRLQPSQMHISPRSTMALKFPSYAFQ